MGIAVITGSAGLIGSTAARHFAGLGLHVIGIDNDMRREFFGESASTRWQQAALERELGNDYTHTTLDIRDKDGVDALFAAHGDAIGLVIHTAAQPSHDWAADDPATDFDVNAVGTLRLLEATRRHSPDAVFIFTSTNKVYGDRPNRLPLIETPTRWEIDPGHHYAGGIDEQMPIDDCLHSLFGVSKASADLLVQEYGRYFGLSTACFRGGCLTGPNHSATTQHGFLAYLMRSCVAGTPYRVFGYGGKQVRDNIHSRDLVAAFEHFFLAPRRGEVYNIGGGRGSNCSMLEAIEHCERLSGRELDWTYEDTNRKGDHIWYISDLSKFQSHYPNWRLSYDIGAICREIYESNAERWQQEVVHAG
ncbi:MAG: NAD-dependent epimerase/dehydratase family protein [Planctomycetota bacterium]